MRRLFRRTVATALAFATAGLLTGAVVAQSPSDHRLRPTPIGAQTVAGFLAPVPGEKDVVFVEIHDVSNPAMPVFLNRLPAGKIDPTSGSFEIKLPAPIGPHQRNDVLRRGPDGIVQKLTDSRTGALSPPGLFTGLVDGSRFVRGFLEPPTGVAAVRVRVARSGLENELGANAFEQIKSTREFNEDGLFEIALPAPLIAGQVVTVEAVTASGAASDRSTPVTVTDPGSWGRARAYFAGGVVFSKARNDFSHQDLSLAFVIDKGWLQKADYRLAADTAVCEAAARTQTPGRGQQADAAACAASVPQAQARGAWRFRQLNTFFDTRLTSLPVVEESDEEAAEDADEAGNFVDSRKAAVMQLGVYAPAYGPQTSWVHEGAVNALFVAPLFRMGIQTIPGTDDQPARNARGIPDDVFTMWSFGFAIGHHKLSGTTNQTPEVISYMHITWGRAEAFEFPELDADGNTIPDPATGGVKVVSPRRAMVEGRLKIPNTALQVGFDANLGEGNDDIRFVFGTRFDIGELFGRLRAF